MPAPRKRGGAERFAEDDEDDEFQESSDASSGSLSESAGDAENSPAPRARKRVKCQNCGGLGHNKRGCPRRQVLAEALPQTLREQLERVDRSIEAETDPTARATLRRQKAKFLERQSNLGQYAARLEQPLRAEAAAAQVRRNADDPRAYLAWTGRKLPNVDMQGLPATRLSVLVQQAAGQVLLPGGLGAQRRGRERWREKSQCVAVRVARVERVQRRALALDHDDDDDDDDDDQEPAAVNSEDYDEQ